MPLKINIVKGKRKKDQEKVNFFVYNSSINFQILLHMQNYRYCFMLRAGCSTLDLQKRQVRGTVVDTSLEFYQAPFIVSI